MKHRFTRLFVFLLVPFLPVSALESFSREINREEELNTLTVNFSMMSPHVGNDVWLAVIDAETMKEVGRTHAVGELSFVMEIPDVLEDGKSYYVDFFADNNGNGYYDPPSVDHAWRLEIIDAQGDEALEFSHQIAFTDVEWKHRLRLSLSGMSESINQNMVLYVRENSTGNYLDTVVIDSIPADEFSMDSYVIEPGGNYTLDFYADLNGNKQYDAPPADHSWRLPSGVTVGDLDLEFNHNQDFTNIAEALGVAPGSEISHVSVFPNPATSFLFISMDPVQGHSGTVSVLNQAGVTVLSRTYSGSGSSLELDIGHLPAGMYILQLRSNSHRSFSSFLKQ